MKKVTISLPEWMIQEIDELTKAMEDEFWNKANTWRQVIKKGLAYWSKTKRGSTRRKTKGTSKNQENNNTMPEGEEAFDKVVEMLKAEKEGKDIEEMLKKIYPEGKK